MPTVAESEKPCPDCGATLRANAVVCGCGWKAKSQAPGPDYARIAAEREASRKRLWAEHTGTRACQSRLCPTVTRAMPGQELCRECAEKEAAGIPVPRIGKPKSWKAVGEFIK